MAVKKAAGAGLKEAMLWRPLRGTTVECYLCHRGCKIPDGASGFCRVRKNIGGKLYAMTYGKAAAYEVDPIEKKPFFHFWPGSTSFSISTVGCNFRCLHCCNPEISQAEPGDVPAYDLPPERVVKLARDYECRSVSYTYTEPTVFFEYAHDTGVLARDKGLLNTFVTNGYYTPEMLKKARDFLDAARIDLKGDEQHYQKVVGGAHLEHVLDSIKRTYKAGLHTEVITLTIEGDNDKKDWVLAMADFLRGLSADIPWHFIRFYPAYRMADWPATSAGTLEKMHAWAKGAGMNYVYAGNVPGHELENTYCANCGGLIIKRWSFEVMGVNLAKGNRCPACGKKVPIVGDARKSA